MTNCGKAYKRFFTQLSSTVWVMVTWLIFGWMVLMEQNVTVNLADCHFSHYSAIIWSTGRDNPLRSSRNADRSKDIMIMNSPTNVDHGKPAVHLLLILILWDYKSKPYLRTSFYGNAANLQLNCRLFKTFACVLRKTGKGNPATVLLFLVEIDQCPSSWVLDVALRPISCSVNGNIVLD